MIYVKSSRIQPTNLLTTFQRNTRSENKLLKGVIKLNLQLERNIGTNNKI